MSQKQLAAPLSSWQLLHDFGTNRYYLNIHFVE